MRRTIQVTIMAFLVALISTAQATAQKVTATAQKVTATATNIRSSKGQLVLTIFKDQQSFKDGKPYKRLKYNKATLAKGSVTFSVTLEPGTYGFSIMDDENTNSEMDYNLLGMPKEGFGFSDYYHSSLTRPVLADFDFELKGDKSVTMKMRYL